MHKISFIAKVIIIFINVITLTIYAEAETKAGSIKGVVTDRDTKSPLIGTNITILNGIQGAASDMDGNYAINNLPVGSYTVQFKYLGYETVTKTDIIVKSDRITYLNIEMQMSAINSEEVIVTGGFFQASENEVTSATNFSYEEIRRAPGSAGDVSRILMSLPSVAKVDDQRNSLIVRGGSPNENAFYIDNIEIPNINHFPTQGSSGGPLSLINVDFIQDVDFYAGGFSSLYGDKLSSIMNITFREGNREEFDGQLDLNFMGLGGVFEGPLFSNKGSWLISVRRSYLDFVIDLADVGSTIAPTYGDVQWKLTYQITPENKLTFLGVVGDDRLHSDRQNGIDNDMIIFAKQDIIEGTSGINWMKLWGSSGYSNTSFAVTVNDLKEDYFRTSTEKLFFKNRSLEKAFKFRNVNHFKTGKSSSLEFGIEGKYFQNDYSNYYGEYTDQYGNLREADEVIADYKEQKAGGFLSYSMQLFPGLKINLGLRADYFSFTDKFSFSPRVSTSYNLSDKTVLSASWGIYNQSIPALLLSQNENFSSLKEPEATHYIIGLSQLLSDDTKLSIEAYKKDYQNFPLDSSAPSSFVVDEIYDEAGLYLNHNSLVDKGEAESWGVELTLQKKLAEDFYGLVSASYFRARYKDFNGDWHNRIFDNQVLFNVEGGYKPNENWEFSMRWIYAGGRPYTPFDYQASYEAGRGIIDEARLLEERYPDYHSMNVRVDKRFHFDSTNLVVYLSIWNTYNRKNVSTIFWDEINNKQKELYQWSLLPVFGIEYEF